MLRINSIGTAETRRDYVERLRDHFRPHLESLSHDSQRRFEKNALRILDSKEDAAHSAVREAPRILDHLSGEDAEHFAAVRSLLDAAGVAYEVEHRIVRGLDYYARTVWEFEPPSEDGEAGGQATVGAGGRYDGLIELLGGPPTPRHGLRDGHRAHAAEPPLPRHRGPRIALGGRGDESRSASRGPAAALRLAQTLRAAGPRRARRRPRPLPPRPAPRRERLGRPLRRHRRRRRGGPRRRPAQAPHGRWGAARGRGRGCGGGCAGRVAMARRARQSDPETTREEAVNVLLAELLRDHGLAARAERRSREGVPDIRVELRSGDLVLLECKWEGSAGLLGTF